VIRGGCKGPGLERSKSSQADVVPVPWLWTRRKAWVSQSQSTLWGAGLIAGLRASLAQAPPKSPTPIEF
jgi:hypothetical protein